MAKQYRGVSHLYYAIATEASDGTLTFGTPKVLAPVKAVSRDIASENEKVYADNTLQQTIYGATTITRNFECTRIEAEVVAELLGQTTFTIGTGTSAQKAYGNKPDGDSKPLVAIGYALHDGDVDNPVEVVWSFCNKVDSITKSANTIDDGTGSEGQTIQVTSHAPKKAWTNTSRRELDFALAIDENNKSKVSTFFAQVVTYDNAESVLNPNP